MFRTLSDLAASASSSLGWSGDDGDDDAAFAARLEARLAEERDGLDEDGRSVAAALAERVDLTRVDPELVHRVVVEVREDHGRSSAPAKRAAKAETRLRKILRWREEVGADRILDEVLPHADAFHEHWPVSVHGPDDHGHPVVAERIADIRPEGLTARMNAAAVLRHRVQIMEALAHLKRDERRRRGRGVHKHVWVIDLAGVGVSAFVGDVRAFVMDLVRLCTDKYTDTLFSMWLLNTPYVFRAVWAVVSAALRTSTKEKIRVVAPSESRALLRECARRARNRTPCPRSPRDWGPKREGYPRGNWWNARAKIVGGDARDVTRTGGAAEGDPRGARRDDVSLRDVPRRCVARDG